jgi:hypothetical protein
MESHLSFFTINLLASFVGGFIIFQSIVRLYSISNQNLCSACPWTGLSIVQTRIDRIKID